MSSTSSAAEEQCSFRAGIKGLPQEFQPLLAALVRETAEEYGAGLCSMVLYGSLARGQQHADSDVDVLVVAEGLPRSIFARNVQFRSVVAAVRRSREVRESWRDGIMPAISAILFAPEELIDTPRLLLDVAEDGMVLVDDGTMEAKLRELHGRLRQLGSKRVFLEDGSWYWDLKPDLVPGEVIEI